MPAIIRLNGNTFEIDARHGAFRAVLIYHHALGLVNVEATSERSLREAMDRARIAADPKKRRR